MDFNDHSASAGQHAFLSASQPAWVNYDEHKLRQRYYTTRMAARGVALHDFARRAIELGIKQSSSKKTLNMYINDGIGYKMTCEQMVWYSPNAFGTADAITFRRGVLRIHDLKTGLTKTTFRQLEIYAAYFCLEYSVDPYAIRMEFRIYQNDEVLVKEGDPEQIHIIMESAIENDQIIEGLKAEEGLL